MGNNKLYNKVKVLDGAMGTVLQTRGLGAGEHPEVFAYHNKEVIKSVHKDYILAGSDIIYTNTFGANRYKLAGMEIDTKTAVSLAINLARESIEDLIREDAKDVFGIPIKEKNIEIALSLGPIGDLLEPFGTLRFEEAYDIYKEVVICAKEFDIDIIAIETFTDLYDIKAAVLAVKENSNFKVFTSMSFEASGRTFTGTKISSMALTLEGLGVDAIGFNCSLGPKEILPLVEELKNWTNLPIIVKANAGLPNLETGSYDLDAEDFSFYMQKYLEFGVSYLGGCCGTNKEYIESLVSLVKDYNKKNINLVATKKYNGVCCALSSTTYSGVNVVGERLNPTGKKRFQQALLEKDFSYICKMAIEQEEAGANVLDVNVGAPGVDEVELMPEVIKAVQSVVSIPLQIDSSNVEAIEAGLRVYNGKPIINSVDATDEKLDKILPLVKKYGAAVVGLAMNEEGLPETADERFACAKYILDKALDYGIPKEDIIVDCLALTISAKQNQAIETLKAMRRVKEELGLSMTLGVSNISFGLPAREHINQNFLIQAMQNGLNFPIINPNIASVMDAVYSYKVISMEDIDAVNYIERFSNIVEQKKEVSGIEGDETIESAVLKGLKDRVLELTKKYLETMDEIEVIDNYLIPALDVVGDKYERQILFLPQLINAASAAGVGFDIIKERIASKGKESIIKGKIAIATVKGDIHDIGKNIVKVVLENYGYKMIDLGRDVPIENVVRVVENENLSLVGLSALMTTTLPAMKETIEAIKKVKPECKVFVGGAVLTKEYANSIGADFYAKDARESVEIARKVFS